jgi:diguanylate cyclase (GGDEF)-like protein/PAS domain S-box-containing protein/putative nucleotidyltransferase with HDIG domain
LKDISKEYQIEPASSGDCFAEQLDIGEREALLRRITDNMVDMVMIVKHNAEVIYVSPSHRKVLGYGPEYLLGQSWIDLIHPEDLPKFMATLENARATHLPIKWEYRTRHMEGYYLWMESVGNPIPIEDGWGYIVNTRDISYRKRSEEALQESEKNYSSLFNSMQEGFALWETLYNSEGEPADYRFINVNPAFEKILQVKKREIIGRLLSETSLGFENYWLDSFDQVVRTMQPYNFEGYNGTIQCYLETFIFTPGDNLLAALFIDVTRRKMVEKQLEREREWMTVTLGSIGEGVIATDVSGKVLLMNRVASDLLGWSETKAIGRYLIELLNTVDDINRSFYTEPLHRITQAQAEDEAEISGDTISIVRNGERRLLSNSAASIRDIDGQIIGTVMIIRDVTEKIKNAAKIERLSYIDKLTGLYNRAYVDRIMADEDITGQLPFSLIMGDIDALKLTNDVFGHQAGDNLLVNIAKVIRGCCRESDIMARWGGDEFLMILPQTTEKAALGICERIASTCAEMEADPIELHIALGTATRKSLEQGMDDLFSLAEEDMYEHKIQQSKGVRQAILSKLEKDLWSKSDETEEHTRRLSKLSMEIGVALGLDRYECDKLALLASLHDIGKVALPEDIINNNGNLEPEKQDILKKHTEIGFRMAEAIPELRSISEAILAHHEQWDGSGYPRGLKGSDIPLISRIVHLVDVYDDMIYNQDGQEITAPQAAMKELEKGSGIQFDPEIVQAFKQILIN